MATVPEDMPPLAPDESDVEYGPHERNRFDVYRASSTDPTPVVFFMHGGGFWAGDKLGGLGRMPVSELLEAGLSVVSTNYRFSQHAIYPAPFDDCRRALQFLRHKAANWGLDPTRVAVAGGSAGAGIALWLAFRPDMANPGSDDPVEHQSTRPRCAVTFAGQTSYDPRFMSRLTGGKGHLHPAFAQLFGVEIGVWPELDAEAAQRVEDGAAINFLERDAPPVFCLYSVENRPTTDEDDYSIGIHHPAFGFDLKTRMEALGRECTVFNDPRMLDDPDVIAESRRQIIEFLGRHLRKACS
jgi:acetyl esterase